MGKVAKQSIQNHHFLLDIGVVHRLFQCFIGLSYAMDASELGKHYRTIQELGLLFVPICYN